MRQAVVVIHGIGEQRPMDTVRSFVKAVMPQPENPDKPKFWSKPDPLSELFELRKLTTPQSKEMPPTDFYEYYWAYQAGGTKVAHVVSWAWKLLARRPKNVPQHLKVLWWTLWSLVGVTLLLASSSSWGRMVELQRTTVNTNYLLSAISFLATLAISGIIVNYLGDAARYLNPSPANIDMRRRIRSEGVKLLRELQSTSRKNDRYDRIIVVGHSLGSVIAYDILRHLWTEYNLRSRKEPGVGQEALHEIERAGQEMAKKPDGNAEDFQAKQRALWQEERNLGNEWIVTDLITAGSPLAHATLLLAQTEGELRERQGERELPICPPVAEGESYAYPILVDQEGGRGEVLVLHHAAVFACTRWTNLYFPAKLGFFGDLVGGPLRKIFGPGIRDVAVDSAEWGGLLKHTPLIHTHYWKEATVPHPKPAAAEAWALETLQQAMNLNSRKWLQAAPRARTMRAGFNT